MSNKRVWTSFDDVGNRKFSKHASPLPVTSRIGPLPIYAVAPMLDFASAVLGCLAARIARRRWPYSPLPSPGRPVVRVWLVGYEVKAARIR